VDSVRAFDRAKPRPVWRTQRDGIQRPIVRFLVPQSREFVNATTRCCEITPSMANRYSLTDAFPHDMGAQLCGYRFIDAFLE